jgi:hypothetical protein
MQVCLRGLKQTSIEPSVDTLLRSVVYEAIVDSMVSAVKTTSVGEICALVTGERECGSANEAKFQFNFEEKDGYFLADVDKLHEYM